MKSIVFRPLRLVKKTGKIVVASYPQWNKVRTADYSAFSLTIDNEYVGMDPNAFVYNHEGKPLFWRDFDPESVPVWESTALTTHEDWREFCDRNAGFYAVRHRPFEGFPNGSISYCCAYHGIDCQGTPTFSHQPIDRVAEYYPNFYEWEPLTVAVVVKWLGWWLYQLQNSSLQIGR